jgi:hypothetical protein
MDNMRHDYGRNDCRLILAVAIRSNGGGYSADQILDALGDLQAEARTPADQPPVQPSAAAVDLRGRVTAARDLLAVAPTVPPTGSAQEWRERVRNLFACAHTQEPPRVFDEAVAMITSAQAERDAGWNALRELRDRVQSTMAHTPRYNDCHNARSWVLSEIDRLLARRVAVLASRDYSPKE